MAQEKCTTLMLDFTHYEYVKNAVTSKEHQSDLFWKSRRKKRRVKNSSSKKKKKMGKGCKEAKELKEKSQIGTLSEAQIFQSQQM